MHSFVGTAIWVFGIVPNTLPYTDTLVNATFSLDGATSDTYVHHPNSSSIYLYNVPVYSKQGLDNVEHKLLITPTAGTDNSVFVLDYAIYTYVLFAFLMWPHFKHALGLTIHQVHLPLRPLNHPSLHLLNHLSLCPLNLLPLYPLNHRPRLGP
jgi:hypothetical protein